VAGTFQGSSIGEGLLPDLQLAAGFQPTGLGWIAFISYSTCGHLCLTDAAATSSDGGANWRPAPIVNPGARCNAPFGVPVVAAAGTTVAFEQAEDGALCQESTPASFLAESTDSGGSWRTVRTFVSPETSMSSLAWARPGVLWGISDGVVVRSDDSGLTWAQVSSAPAPTGDVQFLSESVGFAAGDQTDGGAVLATTDGGATWTEVSQMSLRVVEVDFISPHRGWLVASSGLVGPNRAFTTNDGGAEWSPARLPAKGAPWYGQGPSANAGGPLLVMRSMTVGYVVSFGLGSSSPVIYQTNDGGQVWTVVSSALPGSAAAAGLTPAGVAWVAEATATAAPGPTVLYVSSDAGSKYARRETLLGSPNVRRTLDVSAIAPVSGSSASILVFSGRDLATASILRTTDGGMTFTRYSLSRLPDISQCATSEGLTVAGTPNHLTTWLICASTLWRSTDGGRRWVSIGPR